VTPRSGDDGRNVLTITGDAVIVITLQRPEQANALNLEVQRALLSAFDDVARDPDARAVVVTGAGRSFCAGGDLSLIRTIRHDLDVRQETLDLARHLFDRVLSFERPVVAAVNGPAIGAGCTLALLCDVVFMADTAYLAEPRVGFGLVPGDGATLLWPLLAGLPAARAYLLSGDRLPAEEAHRIGIVHRVVAGDAVLDEAKRYAARLAASPPNAVRATKRLLELDVARAVAHLDLAMQAEFDSVEDLIAPEPDGDGDR